MGLALAFLRRDLLIWSSYRLALFWQVVGMGVTITVVYFLGTTVGHNPTLISGQSGSYVAFLLSGLAFTDIIMQPFYSVPQAVHDNQKTGTLEGMLLAPISALHLAIASGLFSLVRALLRLTIILVCGIFLFGFWHQANPLTLAIVLLPAGLTFLALGIASSAFIILVKQGDPILVAYGALSTILGGVFFPLQVLPEWVQAVAAFMPLTHALTGVRAGLEGAPPAQVLGSAGLLLISGLVVLPLGIVAFGWAVNRAKQEGSLVQY